MTIQKQPPPRPLRDDEPLVLGSASLDTHGGPLAGEEMGGFTAPGIAED